MLVSAGVFAATLSSALGSYLAGPRVLQAVSRDPVLPFLRPLGKGAGAADEPRRALLFVGVITVGVLLWAGNESGGAALNAVAAIVTMFFLFSYGTINAAAFMEAVGANPSFRPRFWFFHWGTALIGAVGCVGAALLINAVAAGIAAVVVVALVWYVQRQHLRSSFGDARRGFLYRTVRDSLMRLAEMKEDPRNWRPTVLVFSGNPKARERLVRYGDWLEGERGIVLLAHILTGDLTDRKKQREAALRQMEGFCQERDIAAFPVSVVAEDVEQGTNMLVQTAAIGPLRPNVAVFGWSPKADNLGPYLRQVRASVAMNMSVVLIQAHALPAPRAPKRIDVWWRGQRNGGLMMLFSYLLTRNLEWAQAEVRVLRLIENEAGRAPALKALQEVVEEARLEATVQVIVSERRFVDILRTHSRDATCVFLGFELPEEDAQVAWHARYVELLEDMPTTIIVHSTGGEDVTA